MQHDARLGETVVNARRLIAAAQWTSDAGRAARAAAIRDHLLPLVRSRGQRHQYGRAGAIGPLHLTTWESGAFRFVLRAPFSPLRFGPAAEPPVRCAAGPGRGPALPPFGLDVQRGRRVLLSVAWDREGAVEVVAFRHGAWEDEALALS